MYDFLRRWLPEKVAQLLMVIWYLLLVLLVFRKFNLTGAGFRYIGL